MEGRLTRQIGSLNQDPADLCVAALGQRLHECWRQLRAQRQGAVQPRLQLQQVLQHIGRGVGMPRHRRADPQAGAWADQVPEAVLRQVRSLGQGSAGRSPRCLNSVA